MFSISDPAIQDLLEKMLKFNPKERATCASLLKSRVFDSVRNRDLEDLKVPKITM
jgi:serine/threonine protein kinase